MQIIGIAGAAGSGKNTVADILADELYRQGLSSVQDAFARELKALAVRQYGWDGVKDEAGRALLQRLGAHKRSENPDYWINLLAQTYPLEDSRNPDFLIITDVRYENEAEFVRELGVLWFVRGRDETLTGAAAGHESEAFDWPLQIEDVEVYNDSSLEDLKTLVGGMVACNRHLALL